MFSDNSNNPCSCKNEILEELKIRNALLKQQIQVLNDIKQELGRK